MGVGLKAQTAAVPEAYVCVPYLRNGALGSRLLTLGAGGRLAWAASWRGIVGRYFKADGVGLGE